MLRRSRLLRGGGGGHGHGHDDHGHGRPHYEGTPVDWIYPHGVPKRTYPFREGKKHPAFAPNPGGVWASKYQASYPFIHFELNFYRVPIMIGFGMILLDLCVGLPVPFAREQVPNKPRHYFGGNNMGNPHHYWCYQDGWFMPNESGSKRLVE